MTTTPTIWKGPYRANFETAGAQAHPQSIGLANGNILTVWEDDTYGGSGFNDVVGQLFDPLGGAVGAQFELQTSFRTSNELAPKVVAMADGGFVLVYGANYEAGSDFLVVERFDANFHSVAVNTISNAYFISNGSSIFAVNDWEIVTNKAGDYIVSYQVEAGDDLDAHSLVYDHVTNAPGAEHVNTVQNGEDDDYLRGTATFTNGDIIAVSWESDGGGIYETPWFSAEFRITSPTGASLVGHTEVGGKENHSARADDVVVLADDKFVVLYHYEVRNGGDVDDDTYYAMRIGSRDTSNHVTLSNEIKLSQDFDGGSTYYNAQASIVALPDGGFYVVWIDFATTNIVGTRFSPNGTVVGYEASLIANDVHAYKLGDMSLTTDGRILLSYDNNQGEISQIILDWRDTVIDGTEGNDVLTAQTTASFVFGEDGNDRIYGYLGDDILQGGRGEDIITGGDGGDTIQGGDDNDQLFGDAGDDHIYGDAGDDYLSGYLGKDTLNGGAGADTLAGLQDDDTYILADGHPVDGSHIVYAYDTVVESADQGIDTVEVSQILSGRLVVLSAYTLPENVENGVVVGTGDFDLTGNGLVNRLTGNADANVIDGRGGSDLMQGFGGNDTYYIDNIGDGVIEAANGGMDRVLTSVNYTLTAGAEVETFTTTLTAGTGAINLTGNTFAQTIGGNAGSNIIDGKVGADLMQGFGGSDTYYVDNISDRVIEAAKGGSDRVLTSVNYTLTAASEVETFTTTLTAGTGALNLTGNELGQVIGGNNGANIIDGKGGGDTMQGFGGNDIYYVDNATDRVIETANGGSDRVLTSVNYTLGAGVQVETFTTTFTAGTTAINLTGNELAQVIGGNNGANYLDGKAGNDTLQGFGGHDSFAFTSALGPANTDTIADFSVADDTMILAHAIFTGLGASHALDAAAFVIGYGTTNAGQHIIYNPNTGNLYFDDDGNGADVPQQFAHLSAGLTTMTNADFYVA